MELEEDLDKQRLQINREIAALDRENEKWEKHLQTSTNPIAKEYLEIFIKSNKELRELKCTSIAKLEVIKSANEGVMNINIIDDDVWRDILSFAEVEAKTNKDIPPSKSKAVPCFGWDDRDVHAQSDRYIPHINNIIHLPAANKDFEWVDAATKEPHLLSYDSSQTLGYEFRGTAAVLLTEKQTRMCFKPMLCAHLLLEVNKELTDRNVIQAQAKLLLANMHDPERRPVLVLTDLCEVWHVLWLDGATIYQHSFASRDQAVGFIEDFLAGRFDTSEGVQLSAFADRREMEPRLDVRCVRDGAFAEQLESLEGALDPDEIEEMRRAHMIRNWLHPPTKPSWGQS